MAHSHSSRRRSNLRRQALVTAAACLAVLAVVCLACWALVRKPKQEDSTPVAGSDLSAAGMAARGWPRRTPPPRIPPGPR